ncbi:MAG: hypothetical protein ACRELB_26480, partial [Polyangiaceae bacterium]
MEDAERAKKEGGDPQVRMPPALEWWAENFALVRDIYIRRYAVHAQSYDGLLRDPERVIRQTIEWLGMGDAGRALAAPKPENRNFQRPESSSVEPEIAQVFDELHEIIDLHRELVPSFLLKLNATNDELVPRI